MPAPLAFSSTWSVLKAMSIVPLPLVKAAMPTVSLAMFSTNTPPLMSSLMLPPPVEPMTPALNLPGAVAALFAVRSTRAKSPVVMPTSPLPLKAPRPWAPAPVTRVQVLSPSLIEAAPLPEASARTPILAKPWLGPVVSVTWMRPLAPTVTVAALLVPPPRASMPAAWKAPVPLSLALMARLSPAVTSAFVPVPLVRA